MNQQREAPAQSAPPHLPTILDSPVSISDANGMYGTALSLATTSPYQLPLMSASLETPHPFDEPNPFELNFDFLTSPPGLDAIPARSASDMDATQYIDVETFGQHFPSMPDLNFESLRTVSSHPIFDQDQVASFRRSIEKTTQRGHDCMALALQVVNNLSVTREPCIRMVATSNPMTGIEATRTEDRDVDTVLFINRDAAQSVKKILECSCISDQAVALACYLATSKIVDWYGAAIEAVGGRPEDSEQYLKHLRSSQGIMAERIIARPIYMGKYCLDPEVQRVVRAQVVLGELKEHVQPLLNSLPRFHVTGLESDDSTAKVQACALRTQLRTVVQNARNLNGSGSS